MAVTKRFGPTGTIRSGAIDELFSLLGRRPEVISFAAGAPETTLLPGELVPGLVDTVMTKYGNRALQYSMPQGFGPLVEQAAHLLSERWIRCPADNIHIATGRSGALHNVCRAVLGAGDVVLVETPTHGPALEIFQSHGATVTSVESDEAGLLPEALDEALARTSAALVYLLPTFQNPTGRTMPTTRRAEVAEVIVRRNALAVEDDVYADLRYRGRPIPAFWAFAPNNTVYITSLSKTLAPAIRIGIAVLPPDVLSTVSALEHGIGMQTSTLCQAIAAEFLASPFMAEHLQTITEAYSAKLQLLCTALGKYFPGGFRWTEPDGGLFVWVDGPPGFDADAALDRALLRDVAFRPGSAFYADDALLHRNTMRLSFAGVRSEQVLPGIDALAAVCENYRESREGE